MVSTVVTPRVILAGVARLFSQKLNQDMKTMKTAGV